MKKLFLTLALTCVMAVGYAEETPTTNVEGTNKEATEVKTEGAADAKQDDNQNAEVKNDAGKDEKAEQTTNKQPEGKPAKSANTANPKNKPEPSFFQQYGMIIMLVAMFAIMYFLMIRPQRKRQKELQEWRNTIDVGTKVIIGGGIQGIVKETNPAETYLTVEVAKGVNIKVDKNMVFADVEQTMQK